MQSRAEILILRRSSGTSRPVLHVRLHGDVALEPNRFDARLYVRVRRINEPAKCWGVCGRSRSYLHMAQ